MLERLNGKRIGKLNITNGKRFTIFVSTLLILVVVLTTALVKILGFEKDPMMVRINNPAVVGYYNYHHKLYNGTKVFLITTPRGQEYVVGTENLQRSLDAYRASGEYGKKLADK